MISGDIAMHTKRIEIFENERYSPLTGWGAKALGLTDRKALSNHDGSEGYNSMEEANQVLLSFGWQWDETPWMIDKGSPALSLTDADGWTYSSDFTSFSNENQANTNISGTKGLMHFVRRRRLVRNQSFDVNSICKVMDFTCDHCDLKETERLADLFLEKFTQATIRRHPRSLAASKANTLKNSLLIALQLPDHDLLLEGIDPITAPNTTNTAGNTTTPKNRSSSLSFFKRSNSLAAPSSAAASTTATKEDNDKEEGTLAAATASEQLKEVIEEAINPETSSRARGASLDQDRLSTLSSSTLSGLLSKYPLSSYSLERVTELLDAFIQSSSTALSLASSFVSSTSRSDYLEQRRQEIDRCYFTKEERLEWARLLLRKYDHPYLYHCSQKHCGFSCLFRIEQCSNRNCFVQFSHKWLEEHDAICPEKILPCERNCGEDLPRKTMEHHLTYTCELRPVVCPYHCIGCVVEGLLAKTLPEHIETSTQQHLSYLMERVLEQQKVIAQVYGKVHDLETVNKTHWQEIVAIQSTMAAATIALKASESRQEKHLQDSIKSLEQRVQRVEGNLRTELRSEVGKINAQLKK